LEVLIVSMVANYLHIVLRTFFPSENDSPLLIYSKAPKTFQVTDQLFKSIARRDTEILDDSCLIDHP